MLIFSIIIRQPVLRIGISLILRDQYDGLKITLHDSLKSFEGSDPNSKIDLIIFESGIDIDKKGELFSRYARGKYGAKVVVLYDDCPSYFVVSGHLKGGVDGLISRHCSPTEFIRGIDEVLRGKRHVSDEILKKILNNQPEVRSVNPDVDTILTVREYQIAKFLSMGMSTSQIAALLGRSNSTIRTTKSNIFKKLEISDVITLRDVLS